VAATYRSVFSRLNQLLERSHQLGTVERHSAELNSLAEYCSAHLDIAAVQAHPVHIVAYLMHADSNGRTVVHEPTCPAARPDAVTHGNVCLGSCPTRLKGSSVRVKLSALRAGFDELGATEQWTGGHRPTENPARSRLVDVYELATNKEQLAAGVSTTRAPILDLPVVQVMIRHYNTLAADADDKGDAAGAWWNAQCAFLVAFLFTYTDRGHNFLELRWGDVSYVPPPSGATHARPALIVTIRLSKSSASTLSERSVTVVDTDDTIRPVHAFLDLKQRVKASVAVTDAQLSTGHMFLPRKKGVGSLAPFAEGSAPLARKSVESILQKGLAAAGLRGTTVTIHSFRASGADYALAQPGAVIADILRDYHWSGEYMLEYYTSARRRYGLEPVITTGDNPPAGPGTAPGPATVGGPPATVGLGGPTGRLSPMATPIAVSHGTAARVAPRAPPPAAAAAPRPASQDQAFWTRLARLLPH
jgi:hypothetical protein